MVFIDENTSKELFSITNPNELLIPREGEVIDLGIFGLDKNEFTGDGDFTVKSVKRYYNISTLEGGMLTFYVSIR